MGRAVIVTASMIMVGVLGGCGGSGDGGATANVPPGSTDGPVPEFTGPYAAEFAQTYRDTDSDFARGVLADSVITDAEHAEMVELFTACLAGKGITFKGYNPDGGFSTSPAPNPEESDALIDECSATSGEDAVGSMYDIMRINPENLDWATIGAQCLVTAGVVPADYDAEDYTRDNEGRFVEFGALPTDLQEALRSCSVDPLGILEQQQ
ncbi:hypothetical protein [Cellulosimicrobium protaetiae]|uniref:Lipoprotein n=1 Tax=Cellulosimicrobium protaetiae TaxID=2587808 RepID=A0A6M5UL98_9MICO|nr:hypothetical protein [Cellulosimicrobium protaetiae]QJW37589.1 hypothetical protein FIC82_016765 [Cellulosimicrobium protaetiae]